jgi:hypothetical protein
MKAKYWYNSFLKNTLDNWNWITLDTHNGLQYLYYEDKYVFEKHGFYQLDDQPIIDQFAKDNRDWSKQPDYIVQLEGDIFIEPEDSLVIKSPNYFLIQSRSRAHEHKKPSKLHFLNHRLLRNNETHYETVIHFDGFVGKNLYHFLDDGLIGLLLYMKHGFFKETIPVAIHEKIYNIPYVQYLIKMPPFDKVNWLVQKKDQWITCDTLMKARTCADGWLQLYNAFAKQITKKSHRKVFLDRSEKVQRRLTNMNELLPELEKRGFEIVLAENLSYAEQVKLFSEIKYLVTNHGAGITNTIFSDISQLHIIEVFCEDLIQPHFYWNLQYMGVKYYDAILGSKFDINWNYTVDVKRLLRKIDTMLSA